MSDLHEQYAELVRRGMPEHPRLRWFVMTMGEKSWANDSGCVHADDARDLITMHALRWCWDSVEGAEHLIAMSTLAVIKPPAVAPALGRGPTILAAIIAATEHLAKSP